VTRRVLSALLLAASAVAVQLRAQADSDFVFIQPGSFHMGDAINGPPHTITLTHGFFLQKTEVTQAQWIAVMGSNPSKFSTCGPNCPVESVNYDEVQKFIAALNKQTGKHYRLPTEAEWEYAARAGAVGDLVEREDFAFQAWISENSGYKTHPVAQFPPNAWGLYDMAGNVWEWVSDWWSPYTAAPWSDPTGPETGKYRVLRGGAWDQPATMARPAARNIVYTPESRLNDIGFRLARTP
jgi:formylglycine-generating enzyme required for sulfatase activity